VRIPPLRERPTEIEPLARYFSTEFSAQMGQAVPDLGPAAIEALLSYEWPGNVRELKNVMERAVLLAGSGAITREHVLPEPTLFSDATGAPARLWADDLEESTQLIARPRELGAKPESSSRRRSLRAPESKRPRGNAPDSALGMGLPPTSTGARNGSSDEEKRDHLIRALEACGGNQTRAAEMLGISRRTLINRLDRFKLPRPQKR
jgi:two-component system, NtrC family, response regulator AtoC